MTEGFRVLPEYVDEKGNRYTIDMKLGEFRKVSFTKEGSPQIEFIRFESPEGKELMEKVRKKLGEVFG